MVASPFSPVERRRCAGAAVPGTSPGVTSRIATSTFGAEIAHGDAEVDTLMRPGAWPRLGEIATLRSVFGRRVPPGSARVRAAGSAHLRRCRRAPRGDAIIG